MSSYTFLDNFASLYIHGSKHDVLSDVDRHAVCCAVDTFTSSLEVPVLARKLQEGGDTNIEDFTIACNDALFTQYGEVVRLLQHVGTLRANCPGIYGLSGQQLAARFKVSFKREIARLVKDHS